MWHFHDVPCPGALAVEQHVTPMDVARVKQFPRALLPEVGCNWSYRKPLLGQVYGRLEYLEQ